MIIEPESPVTAEESGALIARIRLRSVITLVDIECSFSMDDGFTTVSLRLRSELTLLPSVSSQSHARIDHLFFKELTLKYVRITDHA
jgi:hypothetical protein